MTEAERIAAGLSEAQKAKLFDIGDGKPHEYALGTTGFAEAPVNMTDQVTVTQEDRELAYSLLFFAAKTELEKRAIEYIRDGKGDDARAVQEISAHRIAAEQRGAERLQFLDANDAQIVLDELQTNGWEGLSIEDVKELGAVFAYAIRQREQA